MKAIAKLILFGEHSVVYGKKAIAIPLKEMYIKVEIQKQKIVESKHIKYIKKLLGINGYIKTETNIPVSRGLGSSAALAISMSRLVNADEIQISSMAEKKAHGNPSGIDMAVISTEKALIFEKGKDNKYFETNLGAYIVILDSGIRASTKKAVNKVKIQNRKDIIENLSNITEEAIINIEKKDLYKLGELFNKAQENLKILGLSTKRLDYLINEMNKYSLGSKITGAGLGGCLISLCKDKKQAEILKYKLRKKGIKNLWIIKV